MAAKHNVFIFKLLISRVRLSRFGVIGSQPKTLISDRDIPLLGNVLIFKSSSVQVFSAKSKPRNKEKANE